VSRVQRALVSSAINPAFLDPMRVELHKAGVELVQAPFANADELIAAARNMDGLFESSILYTREVLERLPELRAVCALGIGVDRIDVRAATDLGIVVINLPRVFHREVAAHAMALLLGLIRKTGMSDSAIKAWANTPTGPSWPRPIEATPTHHIYGETLGLVSFGNIARVVARMAHGFEMRVISYDPFVSQDAADEFGVTMVDLDTLLRESDFISAHSPLTERTRHMIGEAQFRLMKPTALFVNTGRGPVVDEQALIRALQEGWIAGAGLDVLEKEPPAPDNPLLHMRNTIITPHIASASDHARIERARWMGIEMGRVLNGRWPLHGLVNRGVTPRFPLAVE
jgi:D-3-phosphoglycerate dehydrogenase